MSTSEWPERVGSAVELRILGSSIPINGILLRIEGATLVLTGSQPGTERKVDIDDIASYA